MGWNGTGIYTDRPFTGSRLGRVWFRYNGKSCFPLVYPKQGADTVHTAPFDGSVPGNGPGSESAFPKKGFRLFMMWKNPLYLYDEFCMLYYNAGKSGVYRTIGCTEIPAYIITHEMGNGENDYILDKIIVDCQMDTRHYDAYHYHGTDNADPYLKVDTRNAAFASETSPTSQDVIKLNMASKPGRNPLQSYRQVPIPTTAQGTAGDQTFTKSSDEVATSRESIALVSPRTRFRRCRIEFGTRQNIVMLQGITINLTEFSRRTYA